MTSATASTAPDRGAIALALLVALVPCAVFAADWSEDFDAGLDASRWARVARGDFEEQVVDVVAGGRRGPGDRRLRLRLATRGTRDDTVKLLGVRSAEPVALAAGVSVSVELDWNAQANGSYLSAALVLSPVATDADPCEASEWVKVEYVGVPPGRNARRVIAASAGGSPRTLDAEGWPDAGREGRPVGVVRLRIDIGRDSFTVREDGGRAWTSARPLGFDSAHLYLLVTSHSNFPPREVFFDEVRVTEAP